MIGVDEHTGKPISGRAHLRQSIARILFTPLGTLMMQPDFGSKLFELIGNDLNDGLRLEIFIATAEALKKWEPRIEVERVEFEYDQSGMAVLTLHYLNLETGASVTEDFKPAEYKEVS